MKTIIHLTLSDLERGHLGEVWYARKAPVSRNEVTQEVNHYIQRELTTWRRNNETPEVCTTDGEGSGRAGSEAVEVPEPTGPDRDTGLDRGNNDEGNRAEQAYLPLPSVAGLSNACRRVQDHIALNKDDDCINIGWCVSILAAEGVG